MICGDFPLLTLSRSSSTMSWVMSTCMACTGGCLPSLSPASLSGAPTRAMPPEESIEVAMLLSIAVYLVKRGGTGVKLAPECC